MQYKYVDLKYATWREIRYLREVEGSLRGLGRPMIAAGNRPAIGEELGRGKTISQSYLSQIETAHALEATFANVAGKVLHVRSPVSICDK